MYVVAHQDDALLFQNPDMQHDITAGKCVATVFVTAGNAGQDSTYWLTREAGAKAASAFMAGVSNDWTLSDAGVTGHPISLYTLTGNPKVTVLFMHLPDGGIDGSGFGPGGPGPSLEKLWKNTIASIPTTDGSSSYSRQDLIDTLLALFNSINPSRINTQDFIGTFGDGDHSDHHAVAQISKTAHNSYTTLHTIYSYRDYETSSMPINVDSMQGGVAVVRSFTYLCHCVVITVITVTECANEILSINA